jgi:hypothetical protein
MVLHDGSHRSQPALEIPNLIVWNCAVQHATSLLCPDAQPRSQPTALQHEQPVQHIRNLHWRPHPEQLEAYFTLTPADRTLNR